MQIVWIEQSLFNKLFEETNKKLPLETGGVLVGYKDIYNNIVVTDLIGAGPNAIHKKYSFIPDGKYQQIELSRIYFESNRIKTYLGDWHSHPYQNSYLSWRDRRTLKKIAKTKTAREPNPLFIIVGTKRWNLKCWKYIGEKQKKTEVLEVRTYV